jgi:WD40 repeat protein
MCAVTVDGHEQLASAGADGTVRIWDTSTGHQHATLETHQYSVYSICAVAVGTYELLASADADGKVRTWDPRTGHWQVVVGIHKGWVHSVCAITVNGNKRLASAGADGTVRIWDTKARQRRALLVSRVNNSPAVSRLGWCRARSWFPST